MSKTPTRRLPDTYNAEVVRDMLRRPQSIVNLEQFEFLQGATEDELRPAGRGSKKVSRRSRRYRGA